MSGAAARFSDEEGSKDGDDDDGDDKDEVSDVNNMQLNYSNLGCDTMRGVIKVCIPAVSNQRRRTV